MMLWLEQKYIGLLSPKLERFTQKSEGRYNFRCPICGDSQKSETKARGWAYETIEGRLHFYCHNCNASMGVPKLIKFVDPFLYNEYVKEKLQSDHTVEKKEETPLSSFHRKLAKPKFIKYTQLVNLKKISQLPHNHHAKVYVSQRRIPNFYHARLFYAPKFKNFVNTFIPDKFPTIRRDEERLIIPFIDKGDFLFGFQGRLLSSTENDSPKYITIMLNETMPKVFNLDRCDTSKPHLILEGPIDAMFLNNAVAMAGGSIDRNFVNVNSIIVFDNEPRSEHTCRRIQHAIDAGLTVSLFPSEWTQKDVNDMVRSGIKSKTISDYLYDNAYNGIKAQLKFNEWKRI